MKLVLAFTRAAYQKTAVYRLDFWAGQLSNIVMMLAGYYLWLALYENRPAAFGVTASQMTTYGVLGMLLQPVMGVSSEVQRYLAQQVRLGTLETDVMKPVDFVRLLFSRSMGEFLVELLLHGLPGLLFAALFLDLHAPPTWQTAVFLHPHHVQFMPPPSPIGQKARFRFDRRHLSATDLITRLVQRYPVKDIRIEEPDIETIVRDIYQHGVG